MYKDIQLKKICVVTTSRADYGLLKKTINLINKSSKLKLYLIVSGTHLLKSYGYTIEEILSDNVEIHKKIYIDILNDDSYSVSLNISEYIKKFSNCFNEIRPDMVMLLGDRYELLGVATVATIFKIPISHIHGGELTYGAIDDNIRHAVTKLSKIHFVASEEYEKRVIQMGEDPSNVFLVGGLGVDNLKEIEIISKNNLEKELKFRFLERNLLVTYHPETNKENTINDFSELLKVLNNFSHTGIIFTMPNSDPGNKKIIDAIKNFVKKNHNSKYFFSLGIQRYVSCLSYMDGVIGNSSSGLLEAPTLKIGTINIGNRQEGRLKAKSVISCDPNFDDILNSIDTLYSSEFQKKLENCTNPYGEGGASKKIVEILENLNIKNISSKKNFYDLDKKFFKNNS